MQMNYVIDLIDQTKYTDEKNIITIIVPAGLL